MAKVSVPKKMPTTEPKPPVSSTPPTTTAMMALKMKRLPARDLRRVVQDRLAHADEGGARSTDRTKSRIVIRSVGMPALRALTLSPPMAKIQLP